MCDPENNEDTVFAFASPALSIELAAQLWLQVNLGIRVTCLAWHIQGDESRGDEIRGEERIYEGSQMKGEG